MLTHPQFDPVALRLGDVPVHWYGLIWFAAFGLFYALACWRIRQWPYRARRWTPTQLDDVLFVAMVGALVGARLGYVLFYKPAHYRANPDEIWALWKGGMAFHGGVLGVALAVAVYAWVRRRRFWEVMDLIAPCVPAGLAVGRLGDFINGDLWGRAADPHLPWAMVFPQSGATWPRHPSQIYQCLLEGVLLFALLWWYSRRQRVRAEPPRGYGVVAWGQISGAFLAGDGLLRFVSEYFREPDSFLGLLALNLSMGQWLSVPMVVLGLGLMVWPREHGKMPGMKSKVHNKVMA